MSPRRAVVVDTAARDGEPGTAASADLAAR
jgi:hypothetical protein